MIKFTNWKTTVRHYFHHKSVKLYVFCRQNMIRTFGNPFQSKSCQFAPKLMILNLWVHVCTKLRTCILFTNKTFLLAKATSNLYINMGKFFSIFFYSFWYMYIILDFFRKPNHAELLFQTISRSGLVFNEWKNAFESTCTWALQLSIFFCLVDCEFQCSQFHKESGNWWFFWKKKKHIFWQITFCYSFKIYCCTK